jgi:hypothetical protein
MKFRIPKFGKGFTDVLTSAVVSYDTKSIMLLRQHECGRGSY